jgi:hypothetical protein
MRPFAPNSWLSLKLLRVANRLRRAIGRPPQPKRCCRKHENMGPFQRVREDKPDLRVCQCRVCGARHFELTADPRHFGLVG